MKRRIFYALTGLAALLLIYSAAVVIRARRVTPALAAEALRSASLTWRDLDEWQRNALLAVEDPAFFTHNGADFTTPGAGLTTITQSIGKQFYFSPFKPGLRKYKLVLTSVFALDRLVPKEDQLTIFLNIIGLGGGGYGDVRGFGAAAEKYFGRKFKDLTRDQYLALVAMVIAPATFNVKGHPEANAERVARIKRLLAGEYKPKGLMDLYYGTLSSSTINAGLPPASYFP